MNSMSNSATLASGEAFLARVRSARQGSAVLKAELIILRSSLPDVIILALEGDDDKIAYGQWIRRIRPDLRYEPFLCGGKKGVRDIKNAVSRDLGGLSERVFFLVDRDFDDLSGFVDREHVFMTETYSVENHIVGCDVLEEILRDEFPCHAKPEIRHRIGELFSSDYGEFLRLTTEINRRIFIARKVGVGLAKRLPTSLRKLTQIQIGKVEAADTAAEEIVVYEREPKDKELTGLVEEFLSLEPRSRYRGKFAMKFFVEWLGKLADEYSEKTLGIFDGTPPGSVRRAEFVLSNFAAKSSIPVGLAAFIGAIQ